VLSVNEPILFNKDSKES
jgi:hypothetical protein